MNEIIEIRIDQLKPGDNPRKMDFKKDEDMENLRSTMEKVGFEEFDPILVYPTDDLGAYEIDDGHRRFHCAAKMEWKRLRAIVVPRPRTEADRFFKRGLRNLNQKKLTNGELVRFVGRLHNDFKWIQEKIAEQTKLSRGHVAKLCIMHTFPIVLEYIDNGGQISIGYELAKIDDVTVMQSLIEQGCTVDSVKEYRAVLNNKEKGEDAEKPKETPLEEEREASTEEELTQLEGHTPGDVLEHPIPGPPGDDGEDEQPEISSVNAPSPDGEPGKEEPKTLVDDANPQPEEAHPESSPSKFTHEWFCWCGAHHPKKIELNKHVCQDGGLQGRLTRITRDKGNMLQPSAKNGNEVWLKNPLFMEMAENQEKIIHIEQAIEFDEHTHKRFKQAFENAKSKIGGS